MKLNLKNPASKRRCMIAALSSLLTMVLITPAQARSLSEIQSSGRILIGVQADAVPYGFIDEQGNNVGNDVDVSRLLAGDLHVSPVFVRVTAANRIGMLTADKVDVLISAMTINAERAKVVQFAKPYSRADTTVFGGVGNTVSDLAGLKDFSVGVTRGSAFDTLLTRDAPAGTTLRRFNDDASTVQAMFSGQVDLIAGAATFAAVIKSAGQQDKFDAKFRVGENILGIAVQQGNKGLTDEINGFLDRHIANGDIGTIYQKWIGIALPPLPSTMAGISFSVQ